MRAACNAGAVPTMPPITADSRQDAHGEQGAQDGTEKAQDATLDQEDPQDLPAPCTHRTEDADLAPAPAPAPALDHGHHENAGHTEGHGSPIRISAWPAVTAWPSLTATRVTVPVIALPIVTR